MIPSKHSTQLLIWTHQRRVPRPEAVRSQPAPLFPILAMTSLIPVTVHLTCQIQVLRFLAPAGYIYQSLWTMSFIFRLPDWRLSSVLFFFDFAKGSSICKRLVLEQEIYPNVKYELYVFSSFFSYV